MVQKVLAYGRLFCTRQQGILVHMLESARQILVASHFQDEYNSVHTVVGVIAMSDMHHLLKCRICVSLSADCLLLTFSVICCLAQGVTQDRAEKSQLCTARLPIDEHMERVASSGYNFKKVLAVNQGESSRSLELNIFYIISFQPSTVIVNLSHVHKVTHRPKYCNIAHVVLVRM